MHKKCTLVVIALIKKEHRMLLPVLLFLGLVLVVIAW